MDIDKKGVVHRRRLHNFRFIGWIPSSLVRELIYSAESTQPACRPNRGERPVWMAPKGSEASAEMQLEEDVFRIPIASEETPPHLNSSEFAFPALMFFVKTSQLTTLTDGAFQE